MNGTGSGAPREGGGVHGPGRNCPSDLALDAWLLGHADALERRRVEEAASSCGACREHVDDLRTQRDVFLASAAAQHLETRILARARERRAARAPFWRRWPVALGGVGLAAAAAVAVVVALGTQPAPTGPEGLGVTGLKGGPVHLETFVRRDGAVLRLGAGAVVRSGDAVGFRVTLGRDGWLALFGTDQGRVVAIVPLGSGDAYAVSGGEATQLPASAVLDATGSEERFAVVVCPKPFAVAAARDALASWAQNGDDVGASEGVRRALAPGCEVRSLAFPKP